MCEFTRTTFQNKFQLYVSWMFHVLVGHLSALFESTCSGLIAGNSSFYSLAVRRVPKRWDTAEVTEVLRREACGVFRSTAASWDDGGGKRRINTCGGLCRLPFSSSAGSWRSCDYTPSSCFLPLCSLTPCIASQGETERAQCCSAERISEPNLSRNHRLLTKHNQQISVSLLRHFCV